MATPGKTVRVIDVPRPVRAPIFVPRENPVHEPTPVEEPELVPVTVPQREGRVNA